MSKKINCIMLIDDNPDDNFFHERVIRKRGAANVVVTMESATEALDYLKKEKDSKEAHPDLIFLDINMPGMNGWEFLHEYKQLEPEQQSKVVVVMLTTSKNPDDKAKAEGRISEFKSKPLTGEMLDEIMEKYFGH